MSTRELKNHKIIFHLPPNPIKREGIVEDVGVTSRGTGYMRINGREYTPADVFVDEILGPVPVDLTLIGEPAPALPPEAAAGEPAPAATEGTSEEDPALPVRPPRSPRAVQTRTTLAKPIREYPPGEVATEADFVQAGEERAPRPPKQP
jgi:hypothetical protein